MAQGGAIRSLIRRLRSLLRRSAPLPLSAPARCTAVGSLYDLVERHPDLRKVIRHYNSQQFVAVVMNTCSLPQRPDGSLRDDCVVFGLFYVDRREAANPQSVKVIRQDYFVVWTDGSGRMRYYSGGPASWKRQGPIYWRDITYFCAIDGFGGPGNCYGCEPRPHPGSAVLPKHWYTENDPDLALDPQAVWYPAFELALAVARQ